MATYKVIQDIEAEDKLLGPLSLKQFIYAAVMAVSLYLCYFAASHHAAFMVVLFLPIALAAGFFAFPWKLNQPTETWALAKIRFAVKPRKRIWNQTGVIDLVKITAPKKPEKVYTDGLSEDEVTSRLSALASTIDSRGWAIKNVNVNLAAYQPTNNNDQSSDRLVSAELAQTADTINNVNSDNINIQASDDILDEQNNPIAQNFERLINTSNASHRQAIVDNIKQVAAGGTLQNNPTNQLPYSSPANNAGLPNRTVPNDYWFLNQNQPGVSNNNFVTFNSQVVRPGSDDSTLPVLPSNPTAEEEALGRKLKAENSLPKLAYSHLHTIQPLSAQQQTDANTNLNNNYGTASSQNIGQAKSNNQSQQTNIATDQNSNADIMNLASNNDLDVATIARQANKKKRKPTDEVVISLH